MNALVGYTGFVGSNLYENGKFDVVYNSKNIEEAYGLEPDLLVYAGLRAEKYLANNAPEKDMEQIIQAEENIKKIKPKKLVLISTVDVFKEPRNVDENSEIDTENLHAYGYNRYQLELWVRKHDPEALIIRLPGLFGKNIKKKFAIGINKIDLLGNGKNIEWREDLNLPSEEQEELIEKKGKEIILSLSKYTGIKKEAIAYYSAQRRYNLFDLLNVIIMQSGKMGWKFSVSPKDWKELCTYEIQDLTLSDKSPAS